MINCITIDDEQHAIDLMEDNIKQIPFLKLLKSFRNPLEAITFLDEEHVDLVFLDIQLPSITGLQFIKTLKKAPMIIIVSAYSNYALESFELNVLDYLQKPVPFERFVKAVNKANDYMHLVSNKHELTPLNYFFVHADYRLIKIIVNDIVYIESMKDYVKIHVENNQYPIMTKMSLKKLDDILYSYDFARIHKSYIVNLSKVKSINKKQIQVYENKYLPLGESYIQAINTYFNSKMIK